MSDAPAFLTALADAFVRSGRYPLRHPTTERALAELRGELRAMDGEVRMRVDGEGVRLDGRRVEIRSPHEAAWMARMREHGVRETAIGRDASCEELGRFLSALTLPPRTILAGGGLAAALEAAGVVRITVNGESPHDPRRRNGHTVGEVVQRLGAAPTEEERAELRTTLVGMGAEAVAPLLRTLNDARERSARRALRDALVALDRVGIPLIGEMIGDERWFVVRNMVDILGEVRGPEALEHFARTVRHPDPRVRRETVLALTRLGNEEAVPLLAVALGDPEAPVRAAAALGLGLTHSPAAVAFLLAHLRREGDGEAERETIRALGRLGDPSGIPALAERAAAGGWLSRHSPASRAEAARALGSIGGERARGTLRELLHDRSEAVREAAEKALR